MPITRVTFKIGTMRKEADWVVYPADRTAGEESPTLFVQSDKRALSIDLSTGKGMLSNGKGHPGFHSVARFMGATEVDVPPDLIEKLIAAQPQRGDTIGTMPGGGVVVIG